MEDESPRSGCQNVWVLVRAVLLLPDFQIQVLATTLGGVRVRGRGEGKESGGIGLVIY